MQRSAESRKREKWIFILSAVLLLFLCLLSLTVGSYPISLTELFRILFGHGEKISTAILWQLRAPRALAGMVCGAVLGLTGAVCQTILNSPLASPDLTGVASGASVGAAIAILLGLTNPLQQMGMAFICGLAAFGILLLMVKLAGGNRQSNYLLAGILVSAAADAILMVLKTVADPERELASIEFWIMGSLADVTWSRVDKLLCAALPALALLLMFSKQILILSKGMGGALSVGLHPAYWMTFVLLLSTWAVAAVVSVAGVIGFAGLIVPHIAILLYRKRSHGFFLLSAIFGGILIVGADMLAKGLSPGAELPLGIFCVAAAVLVLGVLLIRRGRMQPGEMI